MLVPCSALVGATSCSDLFPSGESDPDYQRGVKAGRAQIIRQQYWDNVSKPTEEPALQKRYTPISVPEQTTPGGVVIEAHTTYVETVQ